MATKTIGQLTEVTTAAPSDVLELEVVASGLSRKIQVLNLIGGRMSGGGTVATGGFTLTVAGPSTINGSFVGGHAGGGTLTLATSAAITGGGTLALGGFTLTVGANSSINGSLAGSVAGNISGNGTLATGGFTLTVPATGTAALRSGAGTANNIATWANANALQDGGIAVSALAQKTGTPTAGRVASWNDANTLQDGGFAVSDIARLSIANVFTSPLIASSFGSALGVSLNDDQATSFLAGSGLFMVALSNRAQAGGIFAYRAASGAYCTQLAAGTDLNVATGALSGTTGLDGKLNVSAFSDGRIYIENRLGSTQSVRLLLVS